MDTWTPLQLQITTSGLQRETPTDLCTVTPLSFQFIPAFFACHLTFAVFIELNILSDYIAMNHLLILAEQMKKKKEMLVSDWPAGVC